jgi:hypothetical protein
MESNAWLQKGRVVIALSNSVLSASEILTHGVALIDPRNLAPRRKDAEFQRMSVEKFLSESLRLSGSARGLPSSKVDGRRIATAQICAMAFPAMQQARTRCPWHFPITPRPPRSGYAMSGLLSTLIIDGDFKGR